MSERSRSWRASPCAIRPVPCQVSYSDRWGAAVFVTGMEHSIVQGSGWQMAPWEAVQQAAFRALHRGEYWSNDPRVL